MSKTGIAVTALVLVGAAATAGAWYTGQQLENHVHLYIEQSNQQLRQHFPEGELTLELAGFERSLFSSQARYRVVAADSASGEQEFEFFIIDRIEHGPLPLSRLTSFRWLPVMAVSHAQLEHSEDLAQLFAASAGRAPLTMISSLGYGKGIEGEIEVAPMNWVDEDSAFTYTFSGLSAGYQTDRDAQRLRVSGRVDSAEMTGAGSASLVGVDFNLDRRRDASGLYFGTGKIELDQFAAEVPGLPPLVISEMQQTDSSGQDADGARIELGYRIGSVTYGATRLGSADLSLTLSRLDPKAVKELWSIYEELLQPAPGEEPTADELLAAVQELLDGKPRVSLDNLSVKTANGESRFSLGMDLQRPADMDLGAPDLASQLIGNLDARLVLSKPMMMDVMRLKALFQQGADASAAEMEAAMAVEMVSTMAELLQLGRVEGDNIVSQLNYANGSVTINGQTFKMDELTGLLAGAN